MGGNNNAYEKRAKPNDTAAPSESESAVRKGRCAASVFGVAVMVRIRGSGWKECNMD